jgi:hypothetical protein
VSMSGNRLLTSWILILCAQDTMFYENNDTHVKIDIFNLRIIIYNTMFVISRVSPSLQRTLIDIGHFIWNVLKQHFYDIHNMASSSKGADEANLQALLKEMKKVQGVIFL